MKSLTAFEERIRHKVELLNASGLRRRLRAPSGIDLSSNDYLALAAHPLIRQRMAEAVVTEGCGSTGSRLLRGERTVFNHVERRFADFKRTPSALYFGSGYAANLGVLSAFIERHDAVFCDENNHASIIDGIRLSRAKRIKFRHCDIDHVAMLLRATPPESQKFLVTESLFSMDGDFAPLDRYSDLCQETNTVLIVDEAHAVGLYGDRGSGLIEEYGVDDGVFMSINTAGKALGVAGAFAAGPDWAVDYLIQSARPFIFSTAPPPAIAVALDASLTIVENEPDRRRRLLDLSSLFRSLLDNAGVHVAPSNSPIIPVIIGDNDRACAVAEELQRKGFDVRAIRPPAVPPGTARLRVSVNLNLDEETIRRFVTALETCCAVYS